MSPEPIELSTADESLPQLIAAAAPAFTDKISIKSATVSESSTGKKVFGIVNLISIEMNDSYLYLKI